MCTQATFTKKYSYSLYKCCKPANIICNFSLQLFTECHLIQKLLDGYAKNDESYVALVLVWICCLLCIVWCSCKSGGRRQGYMGHLMRIFNLVYKHCQETADVLMILQDCECCVCVCLFVCVCVFLCTCVCCIRVFLHHHYTHRYQDQVYYVTPTLWSYLGCGGLQLLKPTCNGYFRPITPFQ